MELENKIVWQEIARRGKKFEILLIGGVMEAYQAFHQGNANLEFEYLPKRYRQFNDARWMSEQDIADYVETLKKLEEQEPGTVLRAMQSYQSDLHESRNFADRVASLDLKEQGNNELLAILSEFRVTNQRLFRRAYHYVMLNKFYPDLITAEIASLVSGVEEQSEILKVLFTADKASDVRKEKEDLVPIAVAAMEKGLTSMEVDRLIDEHLQKYAFLGMYFFGREPYSKQDILERVEHLSGKDLEKENAELQSQAATAEKTRQIIDRLNLSQESVLKIETVKEIAFAANDFDEAYTYVGFKMKPFFSEIARRIGLDYGQLIQMLPSEIAPFLERGAVVDGKLKNQLDLRAQDHALVYDNGKISVLLGKELEAYYELEKKLEEDFSHIRELKGQPASPGLVQGIVRILLTATDLNKSRREIFSLLLPQLLRTFLQWNGLLRL